MPGGYHPTLAISQTCCGGSTPSFFTRIRTFVLTQTNVTQTFGQPRQTAAGQLSTQTVGPRLMLQHLLVQERQSKCLGTRPLVDIVSIWRTMTRGGHPSRYWHTNCCLTSVTYLPIFLPSNWYLVKNMGYQISRIWNNEQFNILKSDTAAIYSWFL